MRSIDRSLSGRFAKRNIEDGGCEIFCDWKSVRYRMTIKSLLAGHPNRKNYGTLQDEGIRSVWKVLVVPNAVCRTGSVPRDLSCKDAA